MRTIIEHASKGESGVDVQESTKKSLAELGWTWPDLGIGSSEFVELAMDVIRSVNRANRDLPVSPDSQFIQDAIDRKFGAGAKAGKARVAASSEPTGGKFEPFSFERLCLEQAILILTQIDIQERKESFAREMQIVVGPDSKVYGLMFRHVVADKERVTYETRLRCNDLSRLQTASTLFVSALNPVSSPGSPRIFTSTGAAIGREGPKRRTFTSEITRLEIRSVINEPLFEGTAIPITGRFSLLRKVLSENSAKILLWLSVALIAASIALFALAPDQGWWQWSEQLVGRLATGAFGALLVDGAIEYSALRRSLMAGTGAVTHGAVINWGRDPKS
jgi:hypothetical protein